MLLLPIVVVVVDDVVDRGTSEGHTSVGTLFFLLGDPVEMRLLLFISGRDSTILDNTTFIIQRNS